MVSGCEKAGSVSLLGDPDGIFFLKQNLNKLALYLMDVRWGR